LERHVALLKQKPQILIATCGRLRELVREGHLDYSRVSTLVLDEADTLLNKGDSPDVHAILKDIETSLAQQETDPEYQLVLVSATIGDNVREFAAELELSSKDFIRVQGSESKVLAAPSASASGLVQKKSSVATVQHWHMSCKAGIRPSITADLISVMSPRLTIIFVPTKTETESVASFLSEKTGLSIRILHGDMAQSARSRSIALIRESSEQGVNQILVATDVASRGLDLPNVDLVVQFGVPRIAGKDGTFSSELYTHRTGRTGRVRSAATADDRVLPANTIMLYDPANGEGKLVPDLINEVQNELKIQIQPMAIPSSTQVVDAAYQRTLAILDYNEESRSNDLVSYFRDRLEAEEQIDTTDPKQLLENLARAMAALSNLDSHVSSVEQQSSLLTGDPAYNTVRIYSDGPPLTPPGVTMFSKSLGSGKLGRVTICKDGSAVFDLSKKRARMLVEASVADASSDWHLELPSVLPDI
jgi:superfamily II DNA/RNA helicase